MAAPREGATSTIPSGDSGVKGWEPGLRKISIALIVGLAVLGLAGVLGVWTTKAQEASEGLSISVRHAMVTRPGLATPFSIEVHTEDGSQLPSPVTLRVASPYLSMFDQHGLVPDPSSSHRTEEWTWWTFEVPQGASSFEFTLDARVEPSVQWGRKATAAVEIDGQEMVAVDFATWVMP